LCKCQVVKLAVLLGSLFNELSVEISVTGFLWSEDVKAIGMDRSGPVLYADMTYEPGETL
jgi:hypothetical protein